MSGALGRKNNMKTSALVFFAGFLSSLLILGAVFFVMASLSFDTEKLSLIGLGSLFFSIQVVVFGVFWISLFSSSKGRLEKI